MQKPINYIIRNQINDIYNDRILNDAIDYFDIEFRIKSFNNSVNQGMLLYIGDEKVNSKLYDLELKSITSFRYQWDSEKNDWSSFIQYHIVLSMDKEYIESLPKLESDSEPELEPEEMIPLTRACTFVYKRKSGEKQKGDICGENYCVKHRNNDF